MHYQPAMQKESKPDSLQQYKKISQYVQCRPKSICCARASHPHYLWLNRVIWLAPCITVLLSLFNAIVLL